MQVRIRAAALVVGLGFVGILAGGGVAPGAATVTFSAHCHIVDGSFSSCPDGSSEWSDVPAHAFAKTNAYLYADQADLDPALAGPRSPADTFELMYDECGRTTPLAPGEYFLITFDTVETEAGKEHLNRYAIHVFSDGTIIFFENGKTVPDPSGNVRTHEVEGQTGDAGFGPSPTCSANHLIVEFAIKLTATGLKLNGGYSPDPIFWGATPSKVPPTAADDEGDLKDNNDVTVNVVANDTDPDDSVDPTTVSIVDQPKHGTVVNNGDGTVTFTKDDTFKHNDSFTYNVKDGDGLTSNTATVDITKPCSTDVGASVDGKSSPAAAGKTSKKNTDVDKDGILHQDELKAGTDPCNYDTDGDGLPDPWEVPASIPGSGFDLNGDGSADVTRDQVFGANDPPDPLHKDVYAEIDTYDCNLGGCMPGDPMVHDLNPTAIANVKSMFAGLPAQNPQGGPGVNLHLQQDEHVKHDPNCAQPPLSSRPNFGTADQRMNPQIIDAKALAFRYIISGHSTLASGGCATPSIWDIANNMFREDALLPNYDNTPFGRATVGGSDIVLSLGPVWICPRDKVVAAVIVIPPPLFIVLVPMITVCDRESVLDPGIFPTTLTSGSGPRKLKQPFSRGVGRQDPGDLIGTERRGILQVQGRALAHLLGHALGLAGESAVGNDPTLSTPPPGDYWPPEPYPGGTGAMTYADSLHSTSDSSDHLTFSRTGGGSSTAPEKDVFANSPLRALLRATPLAAALKQTDLCSGCAPDSDGDGALDPLEVAVGSDPNDPASTPEFVGYSNSCSDGIDNNGDGLIDGADPNCVDADGDGLPDRYDNCPTVSNFGWSDVNGNGIGDLCDPDADGDGFDNATETALGSDPFDAASTPESLTLAGTCTDGKDNDHDGLTDAQDLGCQLDQPGVIRNDLIELGINPEGHLNVPGLVPSSGTRTTYVGLRYLPTNAESTAPGCLCEGWGVADATTGVAGYADVSVGGVSNLTVESFRRTADTAVSVVRVGSTFRVTHDYHPSISPNLFEATVTIENISGQDTDVRYRRVMDWDVEPTAFDEFVSVVTIAGTQLARNVLFSSDNGFASPNPLAGPSSIDFTGDAIDSGPDDHGALFDFGFGTLKPGEKVSFHIYYGAAASEAEADKALGVVKAEVYSYGQPNCPSFSCPDVNGPRDGRPNTFIFAFTGVGGESIKPPDTDGDGVLDELDNCPFTKNADQADANLDGIGDACTTPKLQHSTAGFLQAVLDGTTTVEPTSVLLGDEPSLSERVLRIVRFRLDAGLATDAALLTANLVGSLVDSGLVSPGGADAFIAGVLAQLDVTPPVVKVTFPAPDGANGWFVHSPVTGSVTADDPGNVAAIVCTGAAVGTISGLGTTSASAPIAVSGDGTHAVSCSATDGVGNAGAGPGSSATATVKIDTTAPVVTCSANPGSLWPPNHKLVAVTTTVTVTDAGAFVLTSVKSSEPDNGTGDGDTAHDLQDWTIGTADTKGLLRAERSGHGPGRTYTLTYTAKDDAGNATTCAVTVRVPHDQTP